MACNFLLAGHHCKGSSNHLAILGDDYLELLGEEPHNANKPGIKWVHPHGLAGLVFKTEDADRSWTALSDRHIPLEGNAPSTFHHPVELNGQLLGNARFRTLGIAAQRIPNGRVFFCEHGTPELVWRSEWQTHANGASGLAEYVYVTPDPNASVDLFEQAFGSENISWHTHGVCFQAGAVALWYLTRDGVAEHYRIDVALVPQDIERAIGLTVKVNSLAHTLTLLADNDMVFVSDDSKQIVLAPGQAQAVILASVRGRWRGVRYPAAHEKMFSY